MPSSSGSWPPPSGRPRSEEHTSELQSRENLVCRLLLEKKKNKPNIQPSQIYKQQAQEHKNAPQWHCTILLHSTRSSSVSRALSLPFFVIFFFFNDTATTEIYTLSLHDALPISLARRTSPSIRATTSGCVTS